MLTSSDCLLLFLDYFILIWGPLTDYLQSRRFSLFPRLHPSNWSKVWFGRVLAIASRCGSAHKWCPSRPWLPLNNNTNKSPPPRPQPWAPNGQLMVGCLLAELGKEINAYHELHQEARRLKDYGGVGVCLQAFDLSLATVNLPKVVANKPIIGQHSRPLDISGGRAPSPPPPPDPRQVWPLWQQASERLLIKAMQRIVDKWPWLSVYLVALDPVVRQVNWLDCDLWLVTKDDLWEIAGLLPLSELHSGGARQMLLSPRAKQTTDTTTSQTVYLVNNNCTPPEGSGSGSSLLLARAVTSGARVGGITKEKKEQNGAARTKQYKEEKQVQIVADKHQHNKRKGCANLGRRDQLDCPAGAGRTNVETSAERAPNGSRAAPTAGRSCPREQKSGNLVNGNAVVAALDSPTTDKESHHCRRRRRCLVEQQRQQNVYSNDGWVELDWKDDDDDDGGGDGDGRRDGDKSGKIDYGCDKQVGDNFEQTSAATHQKDIYEQPSGSYSGDRGGGGGGGGGQVRIKPLAYFKCKKLQLVELTETGASKTENSYLDDSSGSSSGGNGVGESRPDDEKVFCLLKYCSLRDVSLFERRSSFVFYHTQKHPELPGLYLILSELLERADLLEPSGRLLSTSAGHHYQTSGLAAATSTLNDPPRPPPSPSVASDEQLIVHTNKQWLSQLVVSLELNDQSSDDNDAAANSNGGGGGGGHQLPNRAASRYALLLVLIAYLDSQKRQPGGGGGVLLSVGENNTIWQTICQQNGQIHSTEAKVAPTANSDRQSNQAKCLGSLLMDFFSVVCCFCSPSSSNDDHADCAANKPNQKRSLIIRPKRSATNEMELCQLFSEGRNSSDDLYSSFESSANIGMGICGELGCGCSKESLIIVDPIRSDDEDDAESTRPNGNQRKQQLRACKCWPNVCDLFRQLADLLVAKIKSGTKLDTETTSSGQQSAPSFLLDLFQICDTKKQQQQQQKQRQHSQSNHHYHQSCDRWLAKVLDLSKQRHTSTDPMATRVGDNKQADAAALGAHKDSASNQSAAAANLDQGDRLFSWKLQRRIFKSVAWFGLFLVLRNILLGQLLDKQAELHEQTRNDFIYLKQQMFEPGFKFIDTTASSGFLKTDATRRKDNLSPQMDNNKVAGKQQFQQDSQTPTPTTSRGRNLANGAAEHETDERATGGGGVLLPDDGSLDGSGEPVGAQMAELLVGALVAQLAGADGPHEWADIQELVGLLSGGGGDVDSESLGMLAKLLVMDDDDDDDDAAAEEPQATEPVGDFEDPGPNNENIAAPPPLGRGSAGGA